MRNLSSVVVAAATAAAAAGSAHALVFQGAATSQGSVVVDYSGAGLLSFDVDFGGFAPVVLRFGIDAADTDGIDLNAVLRNFAGGVGFGGYTLSLSQGSFATIGSVHRQFDGDASVAASGGLAEIVFDSPEFIDVEIGNALGSTPDAANWSLAGLSAGTTLELAVTPTPLPEPDGMALMLAGLLGLGWLTQRRRRER